MNQQQAKKFSTSTDPLCAGAIRGHSRRRESQAVPIEHLDMVLTDGRVSPALPYGVRHGPEGPDYMAVGDLSTLQDIPWMPGYARIICNGWSTRNPTPTAREWRCRRRSRASPSEGSPCTRASNPNSCC